MKLDLENKEWKEFTIGELFDVKIGKSIDGNKVDRIGGKTPYITRKESDNGLDGFIDYDDSFKNKSKPVITIGNETAQPFVQEFDFFTGTKVNILSSKQKISRSALFFICESLKKHKTKYSYSFTINSTRLKKQKILLPINSNNNPDFEFMESFIKLKEQEKLNQYTNYITKRFKEIEGYKKVEPIETKEFAEFEIGSLFKLVPGKSKGLNHLKQTTKGVNYLGATNVNNGVLAYVSSTDNSKLIQKGNSIAFIRNGEGSMGYSVYKAEDFIATSDISVGYSETLNREVGLFITTIADKVRGKYNFGYKRSATRLKKEKLLLPINEKGNPDYEYMENFMKQLEHNKIKKYLKVKPIENK